VKEGAEAAGNATANAMANAVGDVAKKVLTDRPFEERYWEAQALKCMDISDDKSSGIPRYDNIFVPLLERAFVELALDSLAQMAGFNRENLAELQALKDEDCDRLQIWTLLKQADRSPQFRRFALIAWGGYGKTTLMRHVAYLYGTNKQRGVDRKIPVLIILGKQRTVLSQENPPDLAAFIEQHHVPSLPGGEDLKVPSGWAKQVLKSGRAVVMLDGLDEVSPKLRSQVIDWINRQTQRYPKSIFILTSRPKAYREASAGELDFSTAYWVQEFDDQQRRDFIDRWYLCQEIFARRREDAGVKQTATEAATDLYHQIQRRSELKDMAKNPLLLTMMATFHRRYSGADLPKRRVDLYQDICQLQLRDRPGARRLETVLRDCQAQEILQPLALEMMMQQTRLLGREAVLANLRQTLEGRSEAIDAADFLQQVTEVSELLIRQEEEYEFSHLSFQEYLAAVEIVRLGQESLLYERLNLTGEFGDSWSRLMLMYVCLVNPTRLIRAAIDQGRPDLADQMYRETTKQIDPALKAELERGLLAAVKESKFAKLEELLRSGQWEAADYETYVLMIRAVGKDEGQFFTRRELEEFPCEDLLEIDRLWVDASQGHFGFSVQKRIWQECNSPGDYGEDWDRFCVRVGWQNEEATAYVDYENLKKHPAFSPVGELPVRGVGLVVWGGFVNEKYISVSFLARRLVNCSTSQF
jgi:hypothetical protein